jgi:cytochrome c-type biogenesis protein CcsB
MKKILNILSAPWLMAICLLLFAISMATATIVESRFGTPVARNYFYNAKWFEAILFIGALNLLTAIFTHKLYRIEKFSIFLFHLAFVVILVGAGLTRYLGFEGQMQIREGESSNLIVLGNNTQKVLPFSLFLTKFIIDYYPGSMNPSGFESQVILKDDQQGINRSHRIYMNHILKHRGYRFYQSSYSEDMKGTVLSVSKDAAGTLVTYLGYLLLALGMAWSLLNRNSYFTSLITKKQSITLLLIIFCLSSTFALPADSLPAIPKEQAEKFGSILIRDYQGRTKPMSTLASDIFRKVSRNTSYNKQNPMQVMLGILVFPEKWQEEKIIYLGTQASELLEINDTRASLHECYLGEGKFNTSQPAYSALQKSPASRSKDDNAIIRVDERLNILFHWFMGNMLTIFPNSNDSTGRWYNPINSKGVFLTADSVFVDNVIPFYLSEVRKSIKSNDWSLPDKLVESIIKYQRDNGLDLPGTTKVKLEQWYYKTTIFQYASYLYLFFGLFLLVFKLIDVFTAKNKFNFIQLGLSFAIAAVFLFQTGGMAIRWIISGHAPWSNAYESMVLISWSAVLAGLIFNKKNKFSGAIAALMASVFLTAANMSWMDPQITNLVPVLKSVWLVIHVAIITSSYGFLGVGSLMALVNLFLMAFQTNKNHKQVSVSIDNLTRIVEVTLIVGLYMVTIGTFLGAIWANVSWGRYWGWDSKETWALITAIIYAFVLHLRMIPGLKGKVLFNSMSLVAFSSVLMTYFGVNFYLTGLHSYAHGEAAAVPVAVYYSLAFLVLLIISASNRHKKFHSKSLIQ